MSKIEQSYLVRKNNEQYTTIASKFDGVRILSIDGFTSAGKAVNIYTAQWIDNQSEDFYVVGNSVITENTDLSITFIVGDKYANGIIDVRKKHDAFISYLKGGSFYLKSLYDEKEVLCACLEDYKPTNMKLKREVGCNWIIGTINVHTLTSPTDTSSSVTGDLYIGFGGSTLSSLSDITSMINVQHYETDGNAGNYTINSATSIKYLWICTSNPMGDVTSNGFEVPMNAAVTVGGLRCYRSANSIAANVLMNFTITV